MASMVVPVPVPLSAGFFLLMPTSQRKEETLQLPRRRQPEFWGTTGAFSGSTSSKSRAYEMHSTIFAVFFGRNTDF